MGRRLREQRLFARTVGLKLRYADFQTFTRDISLREPTNVDSVIYAHVRHLFHYTFNPQWKVRLLGVRASNLGTTAFQPSLLEAAQRAKISQLLEVADRVRERYGFDALQMARSLHPKRN